MIEPLRVVRLHIRHAGSYTPASLRFLLDSSKIQSYVKRQPRNHRSDVWEQPCTVDRACLLTAAIGPNADSQVNAKNRVSRVPSDAIDIWIRRDSSRRASTHGELTGRAAERVDRSGPHWLSLVTGPSKEEDEISKRYYWRVDARALQIAPSLVFPLVNCWVYAHCCKKTLS